jgi:O-antigen/teichoic acid export membrane protein
MLMWLNDYRQRWRELLRGRFASADAHASRQRLRHVLHLLTGNAATMVIGLASVALVARALGPVQYGMLALTFSYAQAIERLVSFQSWQPMIRYGAELTAPEQRDDLKSLLKFGLMLDLAGAVAGWVIAIVLAVAAHFLFHWSAESLRLVVVYATVLLFTLTGMPTAVLRLTGKFRAVAYGQVFSALMRLVACALAFISGAGLMEFALVWMGTQILSSLTTLAVAFYILHLDGIRGLLRAPLRGVAERFPGLWRFTWSANLSLTIWSSTQQFDTLIVGALAGPAEAGLYHIAKRVGRLAQQTGGQVQAVVYPEVARLWASGAVRQFRRVVSEVEILLVCAGIAAVIAMIFIAEPAIRLAIGPQFAAAAPLLIAQTFAMALMVSGSVTRSALLAMGEQQKLLQLVIVSTCLFHATAFLLVPRIGAMGANMAHIAMGTVWLAGLLFVFRRALRLLPDAGSPASGRL